MSNEEVGKYNRARNSWYFGSKCYHDFSFATRIVMWHDKFVNLMHFCVMFVMRSSTQPKTTAA